MPARTWSGRRSVPVADGDGPARATFVSRQEMLRRAREYLGAIRAGIDPSRRVGELRGGRIVGDVARAQATQSTLMRLMAGIPAEG